MQAGTLTKGLHVLTVLATKTSASLIELSRAVEIDQSTAHRLLRVMVGMGFVEKHPETKRYSVGPQFRALLSGRYGRIQRAAFPAMRALVESLAVTVALRIQEGKQMVIIERVESNDLLRVSYPLGFRHSILFGSSGKVFLAFLPTYEVTQLLGAAFSANNRAFSRSLARVRGVGYATSRGTAVKGLTTVSVPVLTDDRRPVAVLSLSWPSAKYPNSEIAKIAKAGLRQAREISKALGSNTEAGEPDFRGVAAAGI
jgi:IclR family KDG regulon transcriptional repressor